MQVDGVAKVTCDFGKRGNKQVAEIVPFESVAGGGKQAQKLCKQVAFLD